MAGRGAPTYNKRQKEQKRKERQEEKRVKRAQRRDAAAAPQEETAPPSADVDGGEISPENAVTLDPTT